MRKRQFKFIFALTFLSVLIWIAGEFIIGELINNFAASAVWAVLCLVGCCVYSLWKCPRDPDDEENSQENHKGDKK